MWFFWYLCCSSDLKLMWFEKMSDFKWLCLPVLHDFVVDLAASSMHAAASARVAHLLQPATQVFICGAQLVCFPNFPGRGNLAIPTKLYWIQPLSNPVCHYGFIYFTNFYLQKKHVFFTSSPLAWAASTKICKRKRRSSLTSKLVHGLEDNCSKVQFVSNLEANRFFSQKVTDHRYITAMFLIWIYIIHIIYVYTCLDFSHLPCHTPRCFLSVSSLRGFLPCSFPGLESTWLSSLPRRSASSIHST